MKIGAQSHGALFMLGKLAMCEPWCFFILSYQSFGGFGDGGMIVTSDENFIRTFGNFVFMVWKNLLRRGTRAIIQGLMNSCGNSFT